MWMWVTLGTKFGGRFFLLSGQLLLYKRHETFRRAPFRCGTETLDEMDSDFILNSRFGLLIAITCVFFAARFGFLSSNKTAS